MIYQELSRHEAEAEEHHILHQQDRDKQFNAFFAHADFTEIFDQEDFNVFPPKTEAEQARLFRKLQHAFREDYAEHFDCEWTDYE